MDDRTFASATELTKEIRDRRIGYVELLDFYQARAASVGVRCTVSR
jgi:hypothetical protein